jgi:single-strand DNA-binding protein
MASVNKVTLLGRLGKDPEVRHTPSGMAICNVSIATSTRRKDKQSGETIEDTQWHRVVFIDRLAEIAGEYLKKGKEVYVEGRLKYGEYTDKDGNKRYTTDIIVSEMQLLGGRDDAGEQRQPQRQAAPQRPAAKQQSQQKPSTGFDDMDDDIPF